MNTTALHMTVDHITCDTALSRVHTVDCALRTLHFTDWLHVHDFHTHVSTHSPIMP